MNAKFLTLQLAVIAALSPSLYASAESCQGANGLSAELTVTGSRDGDSGTIELTVPSGPLAGVLTGSCFRTDPPHEPTQNYPYLQCRMNAPEGSLPNSGGTVWVYGGLGAIDHLSGSLWSEGKMEPGILELQCRESASSCAKVL